MRIYALLIAAITLNVLNLKAQDSIYIEVIDYIKSDNEIKDIVMETFELNREVNYSFADSLSFIDLGPHLKDMKSDTSLGELSLEVFESNSVFRELYFHSKVPMSTIKVDNFQPPNLYVFIPIAI